MNKTLLLNLVSAAVLVGTSTLQAQVEYVDPTMGGQGFLLEPTRPTVSLPNCMVRMYPVRKDQLDDQVHSFPLTIISHRLGELFWMMPGEESQVENGWNRPQAYDQEVTTPYYYSTRFDSSLTQTEFTPTERCGYFRFTFTSGKPVVFIANRQEGEVSKAGDNAVSGVERFTKMAAYFYGEFNQPVEIQSADKNRRLNVIAKEKGRNLEFRYGISFISVEQAKKNLKKEIPGWTFEQVKQNARERWNKALGKVQVKGGSKQHKIVFYTSLYRCYERMINISEDGQYYSAYDHKVHQDPRPFYVDNWLWDTYRALEPLQTLLNPKMEADKIQSYVRMYEQGGWLPCFSALWGNFECMVGNHAAAWFADAWAKGVTNFDLATGYAGVRKNSTEGTWLPWRRGPKTVLDDFLAKHGYMPGLHPGEKETVPQVHSFERRQSVSVTEAQSYDDWCTAQLARTLGRTDDQAFFIKRATNYVNVFCKERNCVWPKDAEGKWIEDYNQAFGGGWGGRDFMTENNGFTYDWDVQHDLRGLFALMGGEKKAEAKLDQLFREPLGRSKYAFWAIFPDASGLVGQFSMGNEPSLHIPYLYNYLGSPWKTQKRIRMLVDTWFTDTSLGVPGDEDGGGLSSFVVFSMMGFYPVTPGLPIYDIGSPFFDETIIRLSNGKTVKIIAKNNSWNNKYVQSIKLNGHPLQQVWFRHADICNGGTIELQMGNVPNLKLGANPASFPPSSLMLDPNTLKSPTF